MKGISLLVLCCLLLGAVEGQRNPRRQQGQRRFFGGGGGFHGGGFPGGGFPGGGFPGGGFPGGGFPGGGGGFPAAPAACRYWCRTPEGQSYCCEDVRQPERPVGTKFGVCPPVRPTCPQHVRFQPPQTCSNDYNCGGLDKCCFDRCLKEHVCKPPSQFGHFGHFG